MFYDLFIKLCRENNVAPTRAALDTGLSKSAPTKWKKTGATPNGETLNKLADYFGVTTDYLLGNNDLKSIKHYLSYHIESTINQLLDEKRISNEQFCKDLGFPLDTVFLWKTGASFSYLDHLQEIANYFKVSVDELLPQDGAHSYQNDQEREQYILEIKKMAYEAKALVDEQKEKAPTQEGERKIDDSDLKFALWGDATDMGDDDLEDVKRYAAFVRERKKDKLK